MNHLSVFLPVEGAYGSYSLKMNSPSWMPKIECGVSESEINKN